MEIVKVYPLDAVYDCPEDVPEDVMLYFCVSTRLVHNTAYNDIVFHYFRSKQTKGTQDHQIGL
jgi:hypothetical protein